MSGKDKKTQRVELVQVKVNGKFIPLKGFVQGFIGLTILGMLKSLKGTGNPKEVEIKIKLRQ
jgi:hypothetical protein